MNKSLKIKDSMAECIQEKLSHLPLSLRVLLLWHMLQLSRKSGMKETCFSRCVPNMLDHGNLVFQATSTNFGVH